MRGVMGMNPKEEWKETADFQRYCDEHALFIRLLFEKYPHKERGSQLFWKLGKLKERYPEIQQLIEQQYGNYTKWWYDQRDAFQ